MLVKSEDEQGGIPLRRVTDCFVDTLDKSLTQINWGWRMEGLIIATFRVDIGEGRECSCFSILVELLERLNIGHICARFRGPLYFMLLATNKAWEGEVERNQVRTS